MFVFLQVLKLVEETTVKVKYFLRMEVSTACTHVVCRIYRFFPVCSSKKKSVQNFIFTIFGSVILCRFSKELCAFST